MKKFIDFILSIRFLKLLFLIILTIAIMAILLILIVDNSHGEGVHTLFSEWQYLIAVLCTSMLASAMLYKE